MAGSGVEMSDPGFFYALLSHDRVDRSQRQMHAVERLTGHLCLAVVAQAMGEPAPEDVRQGSEQRTHASEAQNTSQFLIWEVCQTEGIAVGQQDFAIDAGNGHRIGDGETQGFAVGVAQEDITIAADQHDSAMMVAQVVEGLMQGFEGRVQIRLAPDIAFKKIAEDDEMVADASQGQERNREGVDLLVMLGIQVQVGEHCRAAAIQLHGWLPRLIGREWQRSRGHSFHFRFTRALLRDPVLSSSATEPCATLQATRQL